MNVKPVAIVARSGRVMRPGEGNSPLPNDRETGKTRSPAIPKSQEVKHKQEPLYCTILGKMNTNSALLCKPLFVLKIQIGLKCT